MIQKCNCFLDDMMMERDDLLINYRVLVRVYIQSLLWVGVAHHQAVYTSWKVTYRKMGDNLFWHCFVKIQVLMSY